MVQVNDLESLRKLKEDARKKNQVVESLQISLRGANM
jgi:hypothetical protein